MLIRYIKLRALASLAESAKLSRACIQQSKVDVCWVQWVPLNSRNIDCIWPDREANQRMFNPGTGFRLLTPRFHEKRLSLRFRFPVCSDRAPLLGIWIRIDRWNLGSGFIQRITTMCTNLLNEPVGHHSSIETIATSRKTDRVSLPATTPRFAQKHRASLLGAPLAHNMFIKGTETMINWLTETSGYIDSGPRLR